MGFSKRELKGLQMALNGFVEQMDGSSFLVKSETTSKKYEVSWKDKAWTCTCKDYMRFKRKCKHIFAVLYFLTFREVVVGAHAQGRPSCPKCGMNDEVIRRGYAYERCGRVPRFYCKRCNHRFNYRSGLEGRRGEALAIILSLDLYYRGLSLRQVSQHLKSVYGISVSHTTIYNWIKRYVELVDQYLSRFKAHTSERWHCDETLLKVGGRHLIIWSVLDSETKLLIAEHISRKKNHEEACKLIDKALKNSNVKPLEIVTDGAQSYPKALREKFSERGEKVIHIQGPFKGPVSNNKIERFYRTLRQRFRTIYSLNNERSTEVFAKGFRIFYNHIKPHSSLSNQTPAEASKIPVSGSWLQLIKEASCNSKKH